MKLWVKILISIVAANLFGGIGAIFTVSSIESWYAGLTKPPGVPPNWIFGPVWTLLYTMMGIAFALVWEKGAIAKQALVTFGVQFALNVAWTPVFFGAHQLGLALLLIVALWVGVVLTIRAFLNHSRVAAFLLIPYLVWVSYATYLNAGYWWLNRV